MNTFYEALADMGDNREYIANFQRITEKNEEWPHFHRGIEILYFIKGEGVVRINNEAVRVEKGDFSVVNSKQIHSFKTESELCYYYIILKEEFLKKHGFAYKEKYVKNKFRDEELQEYFNYVCDRKNEREAYFSRKAISYLVLLAIKLYYVHTDESKTVVENKTKSKTRLVISVMDFVNENIEKNISLEIISKNLGYSKYYVCRVFKELTGKNVTDYINSQKCLKASEELEKGECTVCETAMKYGYENFPYFSKIFKRYLGKSPSSFK